MWGPAAGSSGLCRTSILAVQGMAMDWAGGWSRTFSAHVVKWIPCGFPRLQRMQAALMRPNLPILSHVRAPAVPRTCSGVL